MAQDVIEPGYENDEAPGEGPQRPGHHRGSTGQEAARDGRQRHQERHGGARQPGRAGDHFHPGLRRAHSGSRDITTRVCAPAHGHHIGWQAVFRAGDPGTRSPRAAGGSAARSTRRRPLRWPTSWRTPCGRRCAWTSPGEVDPTLGKDSIRSGISAAIYGTLAVSIFMLVYYLAGRRGGQHRPHGQYHHSAGRHVLDWHDPDAAGHRGHRPDHRHGRGCQRPDLRAHSGGERQRQIAARRHRRRLRPGLRHHLRLEPDDADLRRSS